MLCRFHFNRSIVAVGGQNETSIIDSVEVYDPISNAWSVRTPLPQPVRCMTSVAYKGSLYVFGGETEKEITRAAYRLLAPSGENFVFKFVSELNDDIQNQFITNIILFQI